MTYETKKNAKNTAVFYYKKTQKTQIFQKTWVMPKFSKFQIHPWQTESVDFVLLDVPEMNHLVVKLKEFQSFVLLGIVSFGDQICGAG